VESTQPEESLIDSAVIAQVCSGDEGAMAVLYDRYARVVYSVALRVLADASAAEDVLQDVFIQLWRNPKAFDASRGSLMAWLAVITRNRAIDHLRKLRPHEDSSETIVAVNASAQTDAERNQAVQKVRSILAEMPQEQRMALEMAFFDGLTHTEIAGKTGQPLGTVKTRIRSGLLTLRKAFAA
jgi:RNA polymerase sigma-70 factor (ECF subfamily)